MKDSFLKILRGYQSFRQKYALSDGAVLRYLSYYGQQPQVMVVACCDSRVDPALILQCDPGDLFVVRNVANIVPPYEKDDLHHGTSAALEFGIRFLKVKHLILLGHSQCGGIQTLLDRRAENNNDFISNWVSLINIDGLQPDNVDHCARLAVNQSYQNCLTFPWLHTEAEQGNLTIHRWFFDIKLGQIFTFCPDQQTYQPLETQFP